MTSLVEHGGLGLALNVNARRRNRQDTGKSQTPAVTARMGERGVMPVLLGGC